MAVQETLYFDSLQANNIAFGYLDNKKQKQQYELLSQLFDFVEASRLKKDTPYVFTTKLPVEKALEVFSEVGVPPRFYKVDRVSVLTKQLTVRF